MKRMVLISILAGASLVAACGGEGQDVSRNHGGSLDFRVPEAAQPGYFSSRSSLDLLSFG
ncbi:hypothetical protein [uncultured Tateyamaria sp.]|uniref:hypothetical protein n=1 Tax=Tateyamaria sp. 1078 TaxID=3417464 RepID=UPI00260DE409|nr:hypothetical protein [uncultured Tateyamaria sp.]